MAEFKSSIVAVPTRYQSEGYTLPFAFGGKAQDVLNQAIITRASYEEDGSNLVTVVAGAGDTVYVERQVDNDVGSTSLEQAFTDARLQAFLTDAASSLYLTPEGFTRILQKYPGVLSTFKLQQGYDPRAGTEYAAYPFAYRSRRVRPRLLTYYGTNKGPKDNLVMTFPIRVEVKDKNGNWILAMELTSLDVMDNGIMEFLSLATNPLSTGSDNNPVPGSWRWTNSEFDVVGGKLAITQQPIRLTVAIPLDNRLTSSIALPSHALGGLDSAGVLDDLPDMDRIDPNFRRVHYVDLGSLYQLWLRVGAFPIPKSLGGWTGANDAAPNFTTSDAGLRSDKAMLQAHGRKILYELGRLSKRGKLIFDGYIVTGYPPGTAIKGLTAIGVTGIPDFPLRAVVERVHWYCEPGSVRTELILR